MTNVRAQTTESRLTQLLGELHTFAERNVRDARKAASSLGAARSAAQETGAEAKLDADRDQVTSQQMTHLHDIIYTVVSIVVSMFGGGGSAGGASAGGQMSQAMSKALKALGPLGAIIEGAVNGYQSGGGGGAAIGALQGARDWLLGSAGLAGRGLSEGNQLLQDLLRQGELAKAGEVPVDGVPIKDVFSTEQLEQLSRLAELRSTVEQAAAMNKGFANDTLLDAARDRSEAEAAYQQLAEQLADAEAAAKRRRAKAQVERANIERAILDREANRTRA